MLLSRLHIAVWWRIFTAQRYQARHEPKEQQEQVKISAVHQSLAR